MNQIKPKKSLGQHFLKDGNIISKIVEAVPANAEDPVIEIGPGTGRLTEKLLQRHGRLKAVELDGRAVDLLEEKFPGLDVLHADILKVSWDDLLKESGDIHIVGNLPYFITSQILFKILENRLRLKSATLMMQKEVARRLIAVPRTKDYGILSVQVQLMSSPRIAFDVSRNAFYPSPNVTSSVVVLHFDRPGLACRDDNLKTVVRTAFQQRRKKMSNSLKGIGPLPAGPGFNYDKRAEAWEPATYEKLTAQLEQDGTLA
ncbi:MAG: 16S rRNA (adenine(1518)-N(6)/adenine(1519)-N(6))-dimethyltransferase RsmA [Balneolaceae bacterium]